MGRAGAMLLLSVSMLPFPLVGFLSHLCPQAQTAVLTNMPQLFFSLQISPVSSQEVVLAHLAWCLSLGGCTGQQLLASSLCVVSRGQGQIHVPACTSVALGESKIFAHLLENKDGYAWEKTKMTLQMPICPKNTEPFLPFSGKITGFGAASIGANTAEILMDLVLLLLTCLGLLTTVSLVKIFFKQRGARTIFSFLLIISFD